MATTDNKSKIFDAQDDNDALLRFRSAWLRKIAWAWANNAESEVATGTDVSGDVRGFPKEWDNLQLRATLADKFRWVGSTWSWPASTAEHEDVLTLYLPLKWDKTISEAEMATALAVYSKQRPSIFSKTSNDGGVDRRFSLSTLRSLSDGVGPIRFADSEKVSGLMPIWNDFKELQVALLSTMAKSWAVENFYEVLSEDPVAALYQTRGFDLKWKLQIRLVHDDNQKWDTNSGQWVFDGASSNILELCLPTKPILGAAQVIALGAYNAAGADYPFSCCP